MRLTVNRDRPDISPSTQDTARLNCTHVNELRLAVNRDRPNVSACAQYGARFYRTHVNKLSPAIDGNWSNVSACAERCTGHDVAEVNNLSLAISSDGPKIAASTELLSRQDICLINGNSLPVNLLQDKITLRTKALDRLDGAIVITLHQNLILCLLIRDNSRLANRLDLNDWLEISRKSNKATRLGALNPSVRRLNRLAYYLLARRRKAFSDVNETLGVFSSAACRIYIGNAPILLRTHLIGAHLWRCWPRLTNHRGSGNSRPCGHARSSDRLASRNLSTSRRSGSSRRQDVGDSLPQIFGSSCLLQLLPRQHLREGRLLRRLRAGLPCFEGRSKSLA